MRDEPPVLADNGARDLEPAHVVGSPRGEHAAMATPMREDNRESHRSNPIRRLHLPPRPATQQLLEAIRVRRLGQVLVEAGVERRLDVGVLSVAAQRDQPRARVAAVAARMRRASSKPLITGRPRSTSARSGLHALDQLGALQRRSRR